MHMISAAEDLEENAKDILALTSPVIDGLEKLTKITQKSLVLLRLIGPVGSVIATGISTVIDVAFLNWIVSIKKLNMQDDEVLEEIRTLNGKINTRFDQLENLASMILTYMENAGTIIEYKKVIGILCFTLIEF